MARADEGRDMSWNQLQPLVIVTIVAGVLGTFVSRGYLLARLKARHRETWNILGRPVFLRGDSTSFEKTHRFVAQRRYLELGDERLDLAVRAGRVCRVVAVIGFGALIAGIVYTFVTAP